MRQMKPQWNKMVPVCDHPGGGQQLASLDNIGLNSNMQCSDVGIAADRRVQWTHLHRGFDCTAIIVAHVEKLRV